MTIIQFLLSKLGDETGAIILEHLPTSEVVPSDGSIKKIIIDKKE